MSKNLKLSSLVVFAFVVVLQSARVYADCDKVRCGTIISVCGLTCSCDLPVCECCPECASCLGDLYEECCDCFDMCGIKNTTTTTETKDTTTKVFTKDTVVFSVINFTQDTTPKGDKMEKICLSSNLTSPAPCATSHGCSWCSNACARGGYGYFCCFESKCCCYQQPAYCYGCSERNQCL